MTEKPLFYVATFLITMLPIWICFATLCSPYIVIMMGFLCMAIYASNVAYFLWALFALKKHAIKKLLPFSFNCFSALLFFILKIDWLASEFYQEHSRLNAVL